MTGFIRKLLNFSLAVLKWPLALAMTCLLPSTFTQLLVLLESTTLQSVQVAPFIYGFVGYAAAWFVLFKRYFVGSWISTLEHELTHGFFAVLTLHKIVEVKTSYISGGHIKYEGGGNWLITIAPYFFPTISFIIMAILALADSGAHPWLNLWLGISVSYHITSTWRETHWGQSDIKEVGYIYSLLFLPSANLISYTAILAFVLGGSHQLQLSFQAIAQGFSWML